MKNVMNTTEYLVDRIADYRIKKGLTQEAFAELMNVSPRSIRAWESGETIPKVIHLIQLANNLGIDIGRLFS